MGKVTIEGLELYLKMKYIEKNDGLHTYTKESMTQSLFMKLVEEMGEVAEALNKRVGRKADDGESELAKELADVIHYAVAIAAVNDIDLADVILTKDVEASVKYNQSPNLMEYLEIKE